MLKELKIILVLIILLNKIPCQAQSNYKVTSDSFTIYGSSNIRDWAATIEEVDGVASITKADEFHYDIHEVRILIHTSSIKSIGVEGDAMNKKIYETLKTGRYPAISFMTTSALKSIPADGKEYFIEATGILTVAGVSKVVRIHSVISTVKPERITAEGNVLLKMSDFDIDPPTTLFGLLRVKDDISIHFKISLLPVEY